MGILMILVFVSGLIALFGYIIHDPVPDVCEPNYMVWTTLAIMKLISYTSRGLGHLGFNEPVLYRNMISAFVNLQPIQPDPEVKVTDMVFDGVKVRLYEPIRGSVPKRGIVYYHGGGWTFGDLDTYENMLMKISKDLGAVAVSVDYSMAPENPFPKAVEDSEAATVYFLKHAEKFGVNKNRIAVMGDSAGGTLATVISRHLRDDNFSPMPKLQVMVYPVTQAVDLDTPSYRANQDGPFLTKWYMVLYLSVYLFGDNYRQYWQSMSDNIHTSKAAKEMHALSYTTLDALPKDRIMAGYKPKQDIGNSVLWSKIENKLTDPDFSPLFADDLSDLPPVYVSTCQYDVLRDDGFFYVKRLREAGVDVTHAHHMHCYHGWIWHRNYVKSFGKSYQDMIDFINEKL